VSQSDQGREDSEKRNKQAGEKALDLPARSRFGEGRAEPSNDWIMFLKKIEENDIWEKSLLRQL
jgi:hypothetical protein